MIPDCTNPQTPEDAAVNARVDDMFSNSRLCRNLTFLVMPVSVIGLLGDQLAIGVIFTVVTWLCVAGEIAFRLRAVGIHDRHYHQ